MAEIEFGRVGKPALAYFVETYEYIQEYHSKKKKATRTKCPSAAIIKFADLRGSLT